MSIRELVRKLFGKSGQLDDEDRSSGVDDARVGAVDPGGFDFPPDYVKQDDGRPPH